MSMKTSHFLRPRLYGPVNRSHSFSGTTAHSQANMDPYPGGGTGTMSNSPGASRTLPVLGDIYKAPRIGLRSSKSSLVASFKKAGIKMPKVPRPHRTLGMFQGLKRGLR